MYHNIIIQAKLKSEIRLEPVIKRYVIYFYDACTFSRFHFYRILNKEYFYVNKNPEFSNILCNILNK